MPKDTKCLRSSDSFYVVTSYMKWVTNYCTDGILSIGKKTEESGAYIENMVNLLFHQRVADPNPGLQFRSIISKIEPFFILYI